MPVSVLEIDVDDSKFKEFQEKFDIYKETLDKIPGVVHRVNVEHANSAVIFAEISAAMLAQAEMLHKARMEQEKFTNEVEKTGRELDKNEKHTKSIASTVAGMVKGFAEWSSLSSLGMGLLGGGGLWGLSRLGHAAGAMRRSAQGLGVNPGEQQAYGLAYGRFVDANANLTGIADAQSDYNKRWAFDAMGVHDYEQKNAAQLGSEMLPRAKEIFDQGDGSRQYAESHGLLQFYTMDELRRLHAMSMKELQEANGSFGKNSAALGLQDGDLKSWQDFNRQLSSAGQNIENTFIHRLVPLTPGLEKLSGVVVTAVDKIMGSPLMTKGIDLLGEGISWLGDYLSSPQLETDLKAFGAEIGSLVKAVGWGVKWFSDHFGGGGNNGTSMPEQLWKGMDPDFTKGFLANPVTGLDMSANPLDSIQLTNPGGLGAAPSPSEEEAPPLTLLDHMRSAARRVGMVQKGIDIHGRTAEEPGFDPYTAGKDPADFFANLETSRGLAPGMMDALWFAESSRGTDLKDSSKGAKGQFQFMDATAKEYHVRDVDSIQNSGTGAANYLADLKKQFGDDPEKLAAAYNWGPGKLKEDISKYGADWKKDPSMPKETLGYIEKVDKVLAQYNSKVRGGGAAVAINITNAAGADVHVTTTQVASQ